MSYSFSFVTEQLDAWWSFVVVYQNAIGFGVCLFLWSWMWVHLIWGGIEAFAFHQLVRCRLDLVGSFEMGPGSRCHQHRLAYRDCND